MRIWCIKIGIVLVLYFKGEIITEMQKWGGAIEPE
jgi:hypothetical protein